MPTIFNIETGQFEEASEEKKTHILELGDSALLIKGDKGDKGDKGERGEDGKDGKDGARGVDGKQGPKGDKGDKGEDGQDGVDGRDGRDGVDGKDGIDGISVSEITQNEAGKFSVGLSDGSKKDLIIPMSMSGGGRTRFKDIVDWFDPSGITVDYANKKIAVSGGGSGVSDGDYGDVTVSGSNTVWTIDDGAVDYDKTDAGVQASLDLADSAVQPGDVKQPFKCALIELPGAAEDLTLFFNDESITLTELEAVLTGSSTPSVTWTIRYAADRSATGTEVVTGGTTTTSTTTGSIVTSFNNATIPANNWVWLETTAQSGTVGSINITLRY